jgi:hypothetical protein
MKPTLFSTIIFTAILLTFSCGGKSEIPPAASPGPPEVSSQELLEIITFEASDFNADHTLKSEKQITANHASEELQRRGSEVIPQLLELSKLTMMSTIHESETGWTAVRILVSIGEPALQVVQETENLPEDLRTLIVSEIEAGVTTRKE